MKKEQKQTIIQKALENMKVEANVFNLLVFEILLNKVQMKKSELITMLEEKEFLKSNIVQKLTGLNKQNIVRWEVSSGDAIISLTLEAAKQFALAYASLVGEKYHKKIAGKIAEGDKMFNDLVDDAMKAGKDVVKEGKRFGKKIKKQMPKFLRKLAAELEGKKSKKSKK
jgi:hypothetical protein